MKEIYTHQTALNKVNLPQQQTITKTRTKPFVYVIILDLSCLDKKKLWCPSLCIAKSLRGWVSDCISSSLIFPHPLMMTYTCIYEIQKWNNDNIWSRQFDQMSCSLGQDRKGNKYEIWIKVCIRFKHKAWSINDRLQMQISLIIPPNTLLFSMTG